MKTIYISGRITGIPYDEAFETFYSAEKKLQNVGYAVINPMAHIHFNESFTWFDYLGECIKLLGKCGNIYMLKDWQLSDGACIEHEISIRKGIIITYER